MEGTAVSPAGQVDRNCKTMCTSGSKSPALESDTCGFESCLPPPGFINTGDVSLRGAFLICKWS